MMRKYVTFFLIMFAQSLFSQQVPQYSQYSFNKLSYNPAFAGSAKCLDFRTGGRFQWQGFRGAPTTYFASLQKRIGNSHYSRNSAHGISLYVERDEIHIVQNTSIKGGYAFHKRINNRYTASAGIYVGVQQISINTLSSVTNADPVLASGDRSQLHYPDIMPGLLLYDKTSYFSFSVNQLYFHKLKFGGDDNKRANQYLFGAGHRMTYSANWTILPSFLMKFNVLAPPSLDLNMNWAYKENLIVGLGYRVGEGFLSQVRFRLIEGVKVGYAFDFPINKLSGNYTHEIMVSFSQCGGGVGGGNGVPRKFCPSYE